MTQINLPANVTINASDLPATVVVNTTPDYWQTSENTGEISTQLPVRTGAWPVGGNYDFVPKQVYKINIGPVEIGDVISVHAHNEFTNDAWNGTAYIDISLLAVIIMTTNTNANYLDAGVYELCEATGPNVGHNIPHHADITRHGAIEITPAIKSAVGNNDVFIIFNAWAVAPNPGSSFVDVGQDYGRMTVFRWKKTPAPSLPSTTIPVPTVADAGKILGVTTAGEYALVNAPTSGGGGSSSTLASGPITPTVRGSTTVGTASYTNQQGAWERRSDSNKVDFWLRVTYSGANGTGQMLIDGLPFNAAGYMPVLVYQDGVPPGSGHELTANVVSGTKQIALYRSSQTGGSSSLPVDAAGDITISGFYFRQP